MPKQQYSTQPKLKKGKRIRRRSERAKHTARKKSHTIGNESGRTRTI